MSGQLYELPEWLPLRMSEFRTTLKCVVRLRLHFLGYFWIDRSFLSFNFVFKTINVLEVLIFRIVIDICLLANWDNGGVFYALGHVLEYRVAHVGSWTENLIDH